MRLPAVIPLAICMFGPFGLVSARADVISSEPHALGGNRLYVGGLSMHASGGGSSGGSGGGVQFNGPPRFAPAPGPGQTFTAPLELLMFGPSGPVYAYPTVASFFDVFVDLSADGRTASYDTEMLQLNVQGTHPELGQFMLRESLTRASLGRYSVETLPGGLFRIDSFFDVFVDISYDGGQTWLEPPGPSHWSIVPAPSAAWLLTVAGVASVRRRRR